MRSSAEPLAQSFAQAKLHTQESAWAGSRPEQYDVGRGSHVPIAAVRAQHFSKTVFTVSVLGHTYRLSSIDAAVRKRAMRETLDVLLCANFFPATRDIHSLAESIS